MDEDAGEIGGDAIASSLYVGGKLMGCSLKGASGQLPELRSINSWSNFSRDCRYKVSVYSIFKRVRCNLFTCLVILIFDTF